VLSFVPEDIAATEGLRNAELAISNRLKYEKILALMATGVALFNEKNYKDARVDFEQIMDLDPKNGQAKNYLKRIDNILEDRRNFELKRIQAEQFYVSGIENIRRKNFDQAADDFENTLSLIDNYKDTKERLAGIARLKKEYAEEMRLLRLKNIDKEFQNGLLAFADARYKEALSYFEKTLKLDPGNELARKYIARVKDAIRDLEEEVIDEDSPYYDLVSSLIVSGKQLYEKGDYSASRQRWERILKLFPKNRIALEFILKCEIRLNPAAYREVAQGITDEGREFLKEKKFSEALRKFELIKAISPEYPEIDALIAAAKKGVERVAVPGIPAGDIDAKYAEGMALYARGGRENVEKALASFRWIVARDPNNVKALININKIESQLRLGGVEVAEARDRLTEKQRQLVRTYYYNGINYYTNNNFERAIEEWRKVLVIDPGNEKARNNIRKSLVLLGR
jgi:tetratricopeptide (TPR) repeat protein